MTNAIESINAQLRKVTRKRGALPTDDSVRKVLYLALQRASQRWTILTQDWPAALNYFSILGLDALDVPAAGDLSAGAALAGIDAAIDQVSGHRAGLGAALNRLESVIRMNANLAENLSAANSRIRDADVAAEMAALTSARILQQAAVAVLAQAQRQPNLVLFLLDASTRRR